jgi:hypothetical protein
VHACLRMSAGVRACRQTGGRGAPRPSRPGKPTEPTERECERAGVRAGGRQAHAHVRTSACSAPAHVVRTLHAPRSRTCMRRKLSPPEASSRRSPSPSARVWLGPRLCPPCACGS